MTLHRLSLSALTACLAVALATGAVAQTAPQQKSTDPKAASSPHQRTTTAESEKEAPAKTDANPSSASSPHQRQATEGKLAAKDKAGHDQMMKECMKKEQQRSSAMSAEQAKNTCMDQMKTHAGEAKQR